MAVQDGNYILGSLDAASIILGCTELPILSGKLDSAGYGIPAGKSVFDPMQSPVARLAALRLAAKASDSFGD